MDTGWIQIGRSSALGGEEVTAPEAHPATMTDSGEASPLGGLEHRRLAHPEQIGRLLRVQQLVQHGGCLELLPDDPADHLLEDLLYFW